MSQSEALIITALGITVVFVGLLLCVGFIQLFSRIATRVRWGEDGHAEAAPPPPAAAPDAPPAPSEPVPPDILAVIATAIEVERKLYMSRPDAQHASKRPAVQP